MANVRLKGILPQGEPNGALNIASELAKEPLKLRLALVLFDAKETNTDHDSGVQTSNLRVRRFEPITRADDVKELSRLMMRASEERAGRTVLPFDLERSIEDVLSDLAGPDKSQSDE